MLGRMRAIVRRELLVIGGGGRRRTELLQLRVRELLRRRQPRTGEEGDREQAGNVRSFFSSASESFCAVASRGPARSAIESSAQTTGIERLVIILNLQSVRGGLSNRSAIERSRSNSQFHAALGEVRFLRSDCAGRPVRTVSH